MTVPVQDPVTTHTGNGVTTNFAYDFLLLDDADLSVSVDGVLKSLGADYTISGLDTPAGGEVAFLAAPGDGSNVLFQRTVALERVTDYQYAGDFQAQTVNRDFDRLWMANQDTRVLAGRTIRLPPTEASTGDLPTVAQRALRALGFDAAGNPVAIPGAGDASSLALQLLDASAAARGGALVGFNSALAYAAGTVGERLAGMASQADATKGAGYVGYKLNAVGSIGRTLASKLLEQISVKDFGAVGDGAADDTAAFTAAVAYLNSVGGGMLYVPRGTYKTTATVAFSVAGIRIVGAGRTASVMLPATNTNCFAFNQIGGTEWGVQDLAIRYTGNQASATAILAGGGSVAAVNGCIKNVYIERCYNGIVLGNSQGTVIDTVQMWYFTGSAIYSADSLNDLYLHNLFLNGAAYGTSTPNAASIGLNFNGKAHGIMASHIEVIQCYCPLQLIGVGNLILRPAFSTFTDCFFDSSSSPARLAYSRDIRFVGCWFSQRSTGCIVDINCYGTTFIGCSFTNCDATGCLVTSTALFTSFIGCTFDSNGAVTTANGLTIDTNVTDVKVIGGYFGNVGGYGTPQQSGIALLNGVARITIDGATFQNNAFSPMAFGNAATLNAQNDIIIKDCTGFVTRNKGQATVPSASTTVVVNHGLGYTPTANDLTLTDFNGASVRTFLDTASLSTTQFAIKTSGAPGFNMIVGWSARCFNG